MNKHPILLFTPGNRREFMEKASQYHPDAIVIDLEDAVAKGLKEKVRREVGDLIPKLDVECIVRVNPEPEYLEKEMEAVVSKHIFGVMVPKVETVGFIKTADKILKGLEEKRNLPPDSIKLLIGIETALGVVKCYELASAVPRNYAVFCASGEEGDLQASLGCAFPGLLYARAKILLDSRAAGIQCVLDGVFTNIHDLEGLRRDCLFSKELGYDGRALIHPKHIPIARQVYSPNSEELDRYRRMIQAFEKGEAQGLAAISFEGQMVDYAAIKKAKATLSSEPE
jgi:citrate lyase subunit beta/citryl-CoA lyase